MSGFSPESVFYYSKMKPNEIYSAADQYLSSPDKSFEHPRSSRPAAHYDNYSTPPKDDLYFPMQSTDAQVQYYQKREPSQNISHTFIQQVPVSESIKSPVQEIFYQQTSAAKNEQEYSYQQVPTFEPIAKPVEDIFYQQASVLEPLIQLTGENCCQQVLTTEPIQTPADEAAKIMSSSSSSPPRISSKKNVLPSLDLKNNAFTVKFGAKINPGNFFLIFEDPNKVYEDLKLQMKEFYEVHSFFLPISNELLYAAKLDFTNEWGRVQIISSVEKFYLCYFVDEGLTTYVHEEKLFLLDDRFKELPPRSTKAALLGVSGTKWSQTCINYFKNLPVCSYTAFISDVVNGVVQCMLVNDTVNINEEINNLLAAEAFSFN